MSNYTREELQKFREEIDYYYRKRKLFLGLGWAAIGVGLLFFIIGIVVISGGGDSSPFTFIIALSITAGLVLFVLRGALFNRRIKTRKLILKQAKEEHAINQMFEKK